MRDATDAFARKFSIALKALPASIPSCRPARRQRRSNSEAGPRDEARDEVRWQELIAFAHSVPTESGLASMRLEIRRVLEARVTLPSDGVDWVMRVPADLKIG